MAEAEDFERYSKILSLVAERRLKEHPCIGSAVVCKILIRMLHNEYSLTQTPEYDPVYTTSRSEDCIVLRDNPADDDRSTGAADRVYPRRINLKTIVRLGLLP